MSGYIGIFVVEDLRRINLSDYLGELSVGPGTFFVVTAHNYGIYRFYPLDILPTEHSQGYITYSYLNKTGLLTLPRLLEEIRIGSGVDVYYEDSVLYIARLGTRVEIIDRIYLNQTAYIEKY